ncbi:MAG: hypothetical protein J5894_00175, partial [Clostridia bacterium]|nr:hypothetical protein [Clostridia bacterium]
MSKWDEFREFVSDKTADAKERARKLKIKTELNAKLGKLTAQADEEYRKLGKFYYGQEVTGVDNTASLKLSIQTISDINKEINATRAELKEIKRQEEEEKAAKEAEKAAKKAAQQDEKAAKE